MVRGKDSISDIEPALGMNQAQRRRRWTFLQKLQVAQESSVPGMTVTSVARKYGMAPSQLFRWRRLLLQGSQEIVSDSDQGSARGELQDLKLRMRELERLLGMATLENEILRKTIILENSRKQLGEDRGPHINHYR